MTPWRDQWLAQVQHRMFTAAKKGTTGEIFIYEQIGESFWDGGGVTAKSFNETLRGLGDVTAIDLHINSPGGDVSEADAIYTALNAHSAKVNVYIDGLAASAASYIAMAGDTIAIAEHAKFMIHNAWGVAIGNAEEMRKLAGVLDKIDTTIRLIYQRRTGNSDKQLRDWMEAETWFTGQEAKASGFADKVIKAKEGASDSAFVDQMRMRVAVARAR
jgi:ATP-dependent protease ClpP protease subunit